MIVNSRSYDGSLKRSWNATQVGKSTNPLIATGTFEQEVTHSHLGVIRRGTISYEYFWPDRWYNVFRFHQADGAFRNYYCNVSMPPTFEAGVIDYVDLDIDIIVGNDGKYIILDEDEFADNAARFAYPQDVRQSVVQAITELRDLIVRREFPFDRFGYLQQNNERFV